MQFKIEFKVEIDHPEDKDEWTVTVSDNKSTTQGLLIPQYYIDFILEVIRDELEEEYTIQEPV